MKRKMGTKNKLKAVAVRKARRAGVPVSRIAREQGVTRAAVYQFMKRHSIK